jgi:multiple sugar transport system permease protein
MAFQLSYYAKQRLVKRLIDIVMVTFLIITLFPIFWMVYCSFKDNTDILTGKIWPSRAAANIISIENDGDDYLLLSSDGKITRVNEDLKVIKSTSIKSQATSFAIDDKFIWVATANKGLSRIRRSDLKKVESYKYPLYGIDVNKVASSVIHEEGNRIWISLEMRDFEGILEFDTDVNKFLRLIDVKSDMTPFQVLTITKVRDQLYVGGDKGMMTVDIASGKVLRTFPLELGGSTAKVWRIVQDGGKLLLGTSQGLVEFGPSSGKVLKRITVDSGLLSNQVGQIKIADGLLFLGTNQGLSVIDNASGKISNYSEVLAAVKTGKKLAREYVSGDVLSILKNKNTLILGSTSGRLTSFDLSNKKITGTYTIKAGHLLFRWRNYIDMWYNIDFGLYLRNSFIICGTSMLIAMVFATMAAYAFSRFQFPGSNLFGNLILATQMIPAIMYLIPIYIMFVKFNDLTGIPIKGTFPGIILIYSAFFIPFSIWILRGFFAAIPKELEEAGRIDGASQFQVFWHIVLPLAVPGIIATGVYVFLTAWDELMFAWVLCNADTMTIPVGIRLFVGNYQNRFDLMMAAATVATVPVMILFFLLQKHIVKGLTAGAVKG